jgi:flagellar biosynthesis protein FlhB
VQWLKSIYYCYNQIHKEARETEGEPKVRSQKVKKHAKEKGNKVVLFDSPAMGTRSKKS